MTNKIKLILVDDKDDWRSGVKEGLEAHGFQVFDFSNGKEAIEFVDNQAPDISYAFIDQRLISQFRRVDDNERFNGIETAARLLQARPRLFVILFSVQRDISDNERSRALELGVCRFVEKREFRIEEIIAELQELTDLQEAVERFRDQREQLLSTLQEIPVGSLLVDRHWFGWAANVTWRRLEERLDPILYPIHRLPESLQADSFRRAIVQTALDGQESDGISLSCSQVSILKYVHTRARPVFRKNGQVLAASVSLVEETPSGLARLPLKARLQLIAEAIQRNGFDRVRFYRISEDERFLIGITEAGGGVALVGFEGYKISLDGNNHLSTVASRAQPQVTHIKDLPYGAAERTELALTSDCIDCPLANAGKLVGWVSVDRELSKLPVVEADINTLIPFAEEALRAFRASQAEFEVSDDGRLPEVWEDIERCGSPKTAMKIVLSAVMQLTGCCSGLIRVLSSGNAIKVAEFGEFPKHRPLSIPLDERVWAIRALLSGQAFAVQDTRNPPPAFWDEFKTWNEKAQASHDEVGSFAVFPLTLGDSFRSIGVLSIQAKERDHFTHRRCMTLQRLAYVAAMAWVDLNRVENQAAVAQREMAMATLHNLRQPTMALEGSLRRISKKFAAGDLKSDVYEAVKDSIAHLRRIESILNKVRNFATTPRLEMRRVRLADLIEQCSIFWKKMAPELELRFAMDDSIEIQADEELLRQAFDELWENARAAMQNRGVITISLERSEGSSQRFPLVARLAIEDTGPGFPESIRGREFEPAVTTKAQGTGLGLAFVKKVIKEHEGQISLRDVDPHGASLVIEVPLVSGDGNE